MDDETTIEAEVRALKPQEMGSVAILIGAAADVAEHAAKGALELAQGFRKTIFQVTHAGIDAVEAASAALVQASRDGAGRAERLSIEATDAAHAAARSLARVLRGTGDAAGEIPARPARSGPGRQASASAA